MLSSANFNFRPLEPGDAPHFVEAVLESTTTLAQWMPWAHDRYSLTEALSWIAMCQQGWAERSSFEFGIFDAATGALAGGCGLNHFNRLHEHCNLGYWVRLSFQRRGAATEAIGALAHYAFTELQLGRVSFAVAVGNAASLGTARKAGAVEEGIARNGLKLRERFIDAHVLSLVPSAADHSVA